MASSHTAVVGSDVDKGQLSARQRSLRRRAATPPVTSPCTCAVLSAVRIHRALLSVSDKTQLLELALFLSSQSVELISTGGTAKALRDAGIAVQEVEAFTGFPEILSGRVKTLHPFVHGALLAVRGHTEHEAQLAQHRIPLIDLLVVNLYPFEQTVAATPDDYARCVENVDIGGPAMIRSASKNHAYVTVVTSPSQYAELQQEMQDSGEVGLDTRRRLAAAAFTATARYDTAISTYLNGFLIKQQQ
jgi:phosphoribosylaminoimidazolecarboxamide formyltransferase/IMP cyclohydrolase